jgi:hypothetical protein
MYLTKLKTVLILIPLPSIMSQSTEAPNIILATRLHLGRQSTPPSQEKINDMIQTFLENTVSINASKSVIAVDSETKIEGYDYPSVVEKILSRKTYQTFQDVDCSVLRVTPWGSFVPALNALISWACKNRDKGGSWVIVFISAEMSLGGSSCAELIQHMNVEDTLVVGAALPGHDFHGSEYGHEVELNGRTCPWNTLAMWNLEKLALIGFPLVGDGLHMFQDGTVAPGGIEEFATVLLHQRMDLQRTSTKAKLVKVSGIEWDETFEDEDRRKWHEEKMNSKNTRAEVHRRLLGGGHGTVFHYSK